MLLEDLIFFGFLGEPRSRLAVGLGPAGDSLPSLVVARALRDMAAKPLLPLVGLPLMGDFFGLALMLSSFILWMLV